MNVRVLVSLDCEAKSLTTKTGVLEGLNEVGRVSADTSSTTTVSIAAAAHATRRCHPSVMLDVPIGPENRFEPPKSAGLSRS